LEGQLGFRRVLCNGRVLDDLDDWEQVVNHFDQDTRVGRFVSSRHDHVKRVVPWAESSLLECPGACVVAEDNATVAACVVVSSAFPRKECWALTGQRCTGAAETGAGVECERSFNAHHAWDRSSSDGCNESLLAALHIELRHGAQVRLVEVAGMHLQRIQDASAQRGAAQAELSQILRALVKLKRHKSGSRGAVGILVHHRQGSVVPAEVELRLR